MAGIPYRLKIQADITTAPLTQWVAIPAPHAAELVRFRVVQVAGALAGFNYRLFDSAAIQTDLTPALAGEWDEETHAVFALQTVAGGQKLGAVTLDPPHPYRLPVDVNAPSVTSYLWLRLAITTAASGKSFEISYECRQPGAA